jgi:hypothetical protein
MADKMQESIDGMTGCVNSLAQACKDLSMDPHNPEYKNTILEDGKDLMKWMIGLLQQHDLYGVMLALKYVSIPAVQFLTTPGYSCPRPPSYHRLHNVCCGRLCSALASCRSSV